MRIIQITAGTGSFHCGTCMRDNALVNALRSAGHDALLAPLYLPLTVDEADASQGAPLFYGGINVYLQQKLPFFRHTPRWLDRLLDSPALLRLAGKRAGMTSPRELGDLTLSTMRGEQGLQGKELDRLADWLRDEAKPDAIILSNALLIGMARRLREATGARILCFLQGEDGFLDSLPEGVREETWREASRRAADVDLFLPVSRYYGDLMARRLSLDPAKVRVIYPGLCLDGYEPGPPPDRPTLGFLARLCRVKGLELLVDAYLEIRKRNTVPDLQLHVAGSLTAGDEAWVAGLRRRVESAGFGADATWQPNLERDEKIRFLQGLSALCVPAHYGEAFGLYAIEALAVGVPVVAPDHAGFPELIEMTQGGLLYDPTRPGALVEALEKLLLNPQAREIGLRAREEAVEWFSSQRMAREVAAACEAAASPAE